MPISDWNFINLPHETWILSKSLVKHFLWHYFNVFRSECLKYPNSEPNDDENQSTNVKNINHGTLNGKAVQQMTHGFVALFEKELDQVQYSLKEALYVLIEICFQNDG